MLTGPKIVAQFIDQCRKEEKGLRQTANNFRELALDYEMKAANYKRLGEEATSQANAYANAVEEIVADER